MLPPLGAEKETVEVGGDSAGLGWDRALKRSDGKAQVAVWRPLQPRSFLRRKDLGRFHRLWYAFA